jgi:hypothetical protein
MEKDDYRGERIIKNVWPEWVALEGGGLARRWQIELEMPPREEAIASPEDLGESDLEVEVTHGATPTQLHVTTSTRGNAWSDELFLFAAYRLFERLEAKFGRIRTIQGQERNLWRPFR